MDDRSQELQVCGNFHCFVCPCGETDLVLISSFFLRRDSADDGILTGLLAGPCIACALLYLSIQASSAPTPPISPLPPNWLIEPPVSLPLNSTTPHNALGALLLSRRNLVDLATFCSTILIVHASSSWATEARHRRKTNVPAGERSHVPRKESRRTYLYILFSISVTLWILCVKIALCELNLGIWQSKFYFVSELDHCLSQEKTVSNVTHSSLANLFIYLF